MDCVQITLDLAVGDRVVWEVLFRRARDLEGDRPRAEIYGMLLPGGGEQSSDLEGRYSVSAAWLGPFFGPQTAVPREFEIGMAVTDAAELVAPYRYCVRVIDFDIEELPEVDFEVFRERRGRRARIGRQENLVPLFGGCVDSAKRLKNGDLVSWRFTLSAAVPLTEIFSFMDFFARIEPGE